jgi:hypothetical protein
MFHPVYRNVLNFKCLADVEVRRRIVHLVAVPSPKTEIAWLRISPTCCLTHARTRVLVANTSHYCVIWHRTRPRVLTGCTAVFLADLAAGGEAAGSRWGTSRTLLQETSTCKTSCRTELRDGFDIRRITLVLAWRNRAWFQASAAV